MQFLAPRHAGVLHFRRDHGAGGLGGEQELEALPAVVAVAFDAGPSRLAEGLLLGGVFGAEILGAVAGRLAQPGSSNSAPWSAGGGGGCSARGGCCSSSSWVSFSAFCAYAVWAVNSECARIAPHKVRS